MAATVRSKIWYRPKDRGFTLIEILVVIVIIAILLAVALPAFLGDDSKAQDVAVRSYLTTSMHIGKLSWQSGQHAYPAEDALTQALAHSEPELTYGTEVSGTDDKTIQVIRISADRAAYAAVSASGDVFCLESVERGSDGVHAGIYWADGPLSSEQPCDADATSSSGGASGPGLPDPVTIDDGDPGDSGSDPGEPTDGGETPNPVFTVGSFISQGNILIQGGSRLNGSVATNGAVTMNGGTICGNLQLGPEETLTNYGTISCGGTISRGTVPIPDPGPPTGDDDSRMWTQDSYTGSPYNNPWNPNTLTMVVNNGVTVTLTGGTYVFCSLTVNSGGHFYVADNANVRIYFKAPADCGSPSAQFTANEKDSLAEAGGSSGTIAMIFEGASNIVINSGGTVNNGCAVPLMVYAPTSKMTVNASSNICAGIVADTLTINGGTVNTPPDNTDWTAP